jgi:hypothetical protein
MRRMTFWITRDVLVSSQPSTIQAINATMNIMKPTVMRPFKLAATRAAARAVVAAAKVLRIDSSSV